MYKSWFWFKEASHAFSLIELHRCSADTHSSSLTLSTLHADINAGHSTCSASVFFLLSSITSVYIGSLCLFTTVLTEWLSFSFHYPLGLRLITYTTALLWGCWFVPAGPDISGFSAPLWDVSSTRRYGPRFLQTLCTSGGMISANTLKLLQHLFFCGEILDNNSDVWKWSGANKHGVACERSFTISLRDQGQVRKIWIASWSEK